MKTGGASCRGLLERSLRCRCRVNSRERGVRGGGQSRWRVGQEARPPLRHPLPLREPFLLFPSLHLALPFILLTISHGAFLDHMFYPLSPAKQPYYINLSSFPVTRSLPVNSRFPMLASPTAKAQFPARVHAPHVWAWLGAERRSPGALLALALCGWLPEPALSLFPMGASRGSRTAGLLLPCHLHLLLGAPGGGGHG